MEKGLGSFGLRDAEVTDDVGGRCCCWSGLRRGRLVAKLLQRRGEGLLYCIDGHGSCRRGYEDGRRLANAGRSGELLRDELWTDDDDAKDREEPAAATTPAVSRWRA